jgi:hypothetical protein
MLRSREEEIERLKRDLIISKSSNILSNTGDEMIISQIPMTQFSGPLAKGNSGINNISNNNLNSPFSQRSTETVPSNSLLLGNNPDQAFYQPKAMENRSGINIISNNNNSKQATPQYIPSSSSSSSSSASGAPSPLFSSNDLNGNQQHQQERRARFSLPQGITSVNISGNNNNNDGNNQSSQIQQQQQVYQPVLTPPPSPSSTSPSSAFLAPSYQCAFLSPFTSSLPSSSPSSSSSSSSLQLKLQEIQKEHQELSQRNSAFNSYPHFTSSSSSFNDNVNVDDDDTYSFSSSSFPASVSVSNSSSFTPMFIPPHLMADLPPTSPEGPQTRHSLDKSNTKNSKSLVSRGKKVVTTIGKENIRKKKK